MRIQLKALAAIAAAAGLALTAGVDSASASATATTGWRVAYQLPGGHATILQSVTAAAKNDAWAVGYTLYGHDDSLSKAAILHWNGSRWRAVTVAGTGGYQPLLVQSTSASDVWIFGVRNGAGTDYALHLSGGKWQKLPIPDFSGFAAVALSASDVWVTGAIACTGTSVLACTTSLMHWTGTAWTAVTVPGEIEALTGSGSHVWAAGLNDVKAPGGGAPGSGGGVVVTGELTLLQLADGAWRPASSPHPTIDDLGPLSSFALAGPNGQLWLTTFGAKMRGTLRYWNGHGWADHSIPSYGSGVNTFAAALRYGYRGSIWLGSYVRWTGKRFVTIPLSSTLVQGVAPVPGSASAWGVGQNGRGSLIALYGSRP